MTAAAESASQPGSGAAEARDQVRGAHAGGAAGGLLVPALVVLATLIASVSLPQVGEALQDSGRSIGPWIWPLAAAVALLETGMPPVSLVFPGEWVIFYTGALAGEGEVPPIPLLLLVWASSAAGDTVAFLIGRRFGRRFLLRRGAPLGVTEDRLAGVKDWFRRYGPAAVALGRLVPFVRQLSRAQRGFRYGAFCPGICSGRRSSPSSSASWASSPTASATKPKR